MNTDQSELNDILRQGTCAVANAKINLSIDVLGIDPANGYHLVEMIMQQIPLYDRIFFFTEGKSHILPNTIQIDEQISLASNARRLPLNEKNLVYKAARLMMNHYGITDKISMYIEKHIPAGGGLGGGSADGAAVLRELNRFYHLGASPKELEVLAKQLGSDVPFMVQARAALAQGTGTDLSTLPPMKKGWLLLVNPNLFLSTEKVYKALDRMEIPADAHPDTKLLIEALRKQDLHTLAANMKNVLELSAFQLCPQIGELKKSILQHGALGAMMSGSGATVFGIFEEESPAKKAMNFYREQRFFSLVVPL